MGLKEQVDDGMTRAAQGTAITSNDVLCALDDLHGYFELEAERRRVVGRYKDWPQGLSNESTTCRASSSSEIGRATWTVVGVVAVTDKRHLRSEIST